MQLVGNYFIQNFILLCICLVMYVIAIQRFRQHSRISLYTILLISSALILSVVVALEDYAVDIKGNLYLALACGVFGYSLRPCCVYFLIMMSGRKVPKKYFWLTFMPLILNFIIYCVAFIPSTKYVIFGYSELSDGTLEFVGGPLHYSSHAISALYLVFLLYRSFSNLKAKHLEHGLAVLVCSLFVVLAVIIESLSDSKSNVHLLNLAIAVSTMLYYLYLYMERTQIDTLTGLYNRETYYRDRLKLQESATGVIQFDMNGLKYINDNYGHLEGDKALATIAETITKIAKRSMYAYRLGGDEYIIIANNSSEEDILEAVKEFKEILGETDYYCSIGYSYRANKEKSFDEMLKEAEQMMYLDKEEFYKNAPFERRKIEKM